MLKRNIWSWEKCALNKHLPFGSSYMLEGAFSALVGMKTKQRLNVERSLEAAAATLTPKLSNKQPAESHIAAQPSDSNYTQQNL